MSCLALGLLLQDVQELADRCGSQIEWRRTLEQGLEDARRLDRLVLWHIPTILKSPMDKKRALDAYMRASVWTDPRVVRFVQERCVPVRVSARGESVDRYDLKPLRFVEPGFLVLKPDGEVVHRIDRISTFSAPFILHVLREAFSRAGRPVEDRPAERSERLRSMGRSAEALKLLDENSPSAERAQCLLGLGRWAEALEAAGTDGSDEALFAKGVALFFLRREDEAVAAWRALAKNSPDSPWGWRAAMELSPDGPIRHGFDPVVDLPVEAFSPLPQNTERTRAPPDPIRPAVAFLLRHQRSSGAWLDSRYDFGGDDSLPNVYTAITALCAAALVEWRDVDPAAIDTALKAADDYLLDESNLNPKDSDEYIWAHIYRLIYFSRRLATLPDPRPARSRMERIVTLVLKMQDRRGAWYHEYLNPFVTASVVHALTAASEAGIAVPEDPLARAGRSLKVCRDPDGSFSYHFPARDFYIEGSAGRMPLCELAMSLAGFSDGDRVDQALDSFFKHHDRLLRVRKYDHHADDYHNGGFYYWYDAFAASEAARRLPAAPRARHLERLRAIAVTLSEIDGSFVDSHELGKCYGTAMALLTLKNCAK
jgi:tetratricopeptide (TPR) repeat protein